MLCAGDCVVCVVCVVWSYLLCFVWRGVLCACCVWYVDVWCDVMCAMCCMFVVRYTLRCGCPKGVSTPKFHHFKKMRLYSLFEFWPLFPPIFT